MSTPELLLRLYPRAWRDRYGDEFLMTVGDGALHVQQMIDIVMGAIDAWLSLDVRRAASSYSTVPYRGGSTMFKSMMACERAAFRASKTDALIGAGVMIVGTLILSTVGIATIRAGWPVTGKVLTGLSFPAPLVLSMPFWLMKGQPWRAQTAIVVGTLAILVAIGYLSTVI
jgi:hypothetical protein